MHRLQQLVNHFSNGNVLDFERKIEVSPSRVDKIIKRESKISLDIVERVKRAFPIVNGKWIETGEGEMILSDKELSNITVAPKGRIEKRIREGAQINFYDVDFAMGEIEFHNDTPAIKPAYTMDIPEFAGCTAFRGYSESMEPLIKSGAILFGTKIEDWQSHLEPGQIYGIIMDDKRRYLKYVRRSSQPETHFLLRSENTNYDDFEIPKKKVRSIWLIHGWVNKRV